MIQKVQTALNFRKKKFKIWSNAGSTAEPNSSDAHLQLILTWNYFIFDSVS
jgi:hypothetical protein